MNIRLIHATAAFTLLFIGWFALAYFLIIKKTKGPRERRFIIRASIICFMGIVALTALDSFVFNGIAAIAGLIMFFTFLILRRKQLAIRLEEATNV